MKRPITARDDIKICAEAFRESENYVRQNYELLKRAYGEQTCIAISRNVILGHNKNYMRLVRRFNDFTTEPILIQRLEDFVSKPVDDTESLNRVQSSQAA